MPKKPKPIDGRHRNVPNKLAQIEERVSELEASIADSVEEVVVDVVPDVVREEMRKIVLRWCADIDAGSRRKT